MLKLKSQIAQRVLGYYFTNPDKTHYINELAKILDLDPGNLFRKLKELEGDGLLASSSRGNQKLFSLNKKFPLLSEYRKIYETNWGLPATLKKDFENITGLQEAYIFGSYARGKMQEHSDIDVLLVGNHDHGAVFKITSSLEEKLGREINVVDYSPEEFAKKKKLKDDFILQVLKDKLIRVV